MVDALPLSFVFPASDAPVGRSSHMPSPQGHYCVIVGGGAGGLELAIRLAKRLKPTHGWVTLIDQSATYL